MRVKGGIWNLQKKKKKSPWNLLGWQNLNGHPAAQNFLYRKDLVHIISGRWEGDVLCWVAMQVPVYQRRKLFLARRARPKCLRCGRDQEGKLCQELLPEGRRPTNVEPDISQTRLGRSDGECGEKVVTVACKRWTRKTEPQRVRLPGSGGGQNKNFSGHTAHSVGEVSVEIMFEKRGSETDTCPTPTSTNRCT